MGLKLNLFMVFMFLFSILSNAEKITLGKGVYLQTDPIEIQLHSPVFTTVIHPNIKINETWINPAGTIDKPRSFQNAEYNEIQLSNRIDAQRQLDLTVRVYHKNQVVYFKSSIVNKSKVALPEYAFWSWTWPGNTYYTAGEPSLAKKINGAEWSRFDLQDWIFFPYRNQAPGMWIASNGETGKAPGETAMLFLSAIPREQTISPGNSYTIEFACQTSSDLLQAQKVAGEVQSVLFKQEERVRDINYGKPAPQWIQDLTILNSHYMPNSFWTDKIINEDFVDFPLIIGSTPNVDALQRCRNRGIKVLHYVIYTELLDTVRQTKGGAPVYSEWSESIGCEERDLARNPHWICIEEKGSPMRALYGVSNNFPGLLNTCFYQKELRNAALKQIKTLMESGYDGIFVDLAMPVPECYGPMHGIHSHDDTSKSNTEHYFSLLDDLYALVKSYGDEKVVVLNGLMDDNWHRADMLMWESAIYDGGGTEAIQGRAELLVKRKEAQEARKNGKALLQLTYIPPRDSINRAMYSYVFGRLADTVWTDWFTVKKNVSAEFAQKLYRLNCGTVEKQAESQGPVMIQPMTEALLIWNPSAGEQKVDISKYPDFRRDFVTGEMRDDMITVQPFSGTVLQKNKDRL